jgi:inorganic phosphate transporter, PiT family
VEVALLAVAVAFAVVNGVNDGGALLAVGLDVRTLRPLTAMVWLAAAVVLAPALLGTAVATTLASRLVPFEGTDGPVALLVAVVTAVVVTWSLAARGLPTSLTLAVVGAIAGAGVGAALPVTWRTVGGVLLLAALAPILGSGLGWLATRLVGASTSPRPLDQRTGRWHLGAFALQCLAYGLNDGQKMLAVLAVAASTASGGAAVTSGAEVPVVTWQLATVGVAFLLGTAIGLPRVAPTLGGGVAAVRPHEAVTTELSSATVVLATGLVGSPVSMTQVVSGALVGAGVTRGYSRVRWNEVLRLVGAWVVTLPAAFLVAAGVARLTTGIG